ncbi:hypothetical protein EG329_009534 [Mollisiaceae sp. DMI_Dod_QoI]|nr:hypothetical protein EG329_009534 [Helotiales sp. DMI_Dod_QoI]
MAPYNLRPRVSESKLTPQSKAKAKKNKNPHLDIQIGPEKIKYRAKNPAHLGHITDDPSNGPFTQAVAWQLSRRTFKQKRKGAHVSHEAFKKNQKESKRRTKSKLRKMMRVGEGKGWERRGGRMERIE